MKLIPLACFALATVTSFLGQTDAPAPQLNAAAFKDLTVSALLLTGVLFLYREVSRERRMREELHNETKQFIIEQSAINKAAAEKTGEALNDVAQALVKLQDASRQQFDLYSKHIDALVVAATRK
jgi:hypothetical protein